MAAPFNSSNYVTKGTLIPNGIRTGVPLQPPTLPGVDNYTAQPYSVLGNNYQLNGGGVSLSPTFTYRFRPYGGFVGNIVALTTVNAAGWQTLSGDGFASTLLTPNESVPYSSINRANTPGNNTDTDEYVAVAGYTTAPTPIFPEGAPNNAFLQFDYPRVPAVGLWSLAAPPNPARWGGAMTAPTEVTIFGYDVYNQPIQHTYTVDTVTAGIGAGPNQYPGFFQGDNVQNAKAFYGITGVYVNGTTGPGTQLHVYTCNMFGLPFALHSTKNIIEFSVGSTLQNYVFDFKNFVTNSPMPATAGGGATNSSFTIQGPFGGYKEYINGIADTISNSVPIISTIAVDDITDATNLIYIADSKVANENNYGQIPLLEFRTSGTAANKMYFSVLYPNFHIYMSKSMPKNNYENLPSTSTSSDPRGLIALPDWATETTPGNVDINMINYPWAEALTPRKSAFTEVIFTYYVQGADATINYAAAGIQPQGLILNPPAPTPDIPYHVEFLKFEDLYGALPYYTGKIG